VVVGKFTGQLTYALLGWCASWAKASLSAIVFLYSWLTLVVYHFTSPFSYLGCLAAAFGTQAFLHGCSDTEVVGATASSLVQMLIAIGVMSILDMFLKMGRPSELAFWAYLDAWKMWQEALEQLLRPEKEDVNIDIVSITALINRAEAYAVEARSEPRYWRAPFPGDLFAEMISLARTMRIQVICILTVVCENAVVYGKDQLDGSSPFPKRKWFQDLLKDDESGWPNEINEIFEEMDRTLDLVETVVAQNGHVDRRAKGKNLPRAKSGIILTKRRDSKDSSDETVSLVEDKMTQTSFIFGCLNVIKDESFNLQLGILKKGFVRLNAAGAVRARP
jgi:hypothetical protein